MSSKHPFQKVRNSHIASMSRFILSCMTKEEKSSMPCLTNHSPDGLLILFMFPLSFCSDDTEKYKKSCGDKTPHILSPCNLIKSSDMYVKAERIYPMVLHALERLGHDTGTWLDDPYE